MSPGDLFLTMSKPVEMATEFSCYKPIKGTHQKLMKLPAIICLALITGSLLPMVVNARDEMPVTFSDNDFRQRSFYAPQDLAANFPQLFVCGDSISVGYALNCGLHDLSRGPGNAEQRAAKYKKDIALLADLSKKHKVRLFWVNTTPKKQSHRDNSLIDNFNSIAKETCQKHDIFLIDLHQATLDLVKKEGESRVFLSDGVHFTAVAQQKQAAFIADQLRRSLSL